MTAPEITIEMPKGLSHKELQEKLKDQRWRLDNLYWVVNKEGKRVRFKMNWAQQELYENLHYLNLVLKARQLGITTFMCILELDNAVFTPNTRCGLIAHTRDDAKVIFRDKIQFPFNELPDAIRAHAAPKTDSANELLFRNNSGLRVGTSMRSGTLNFLHISEYGKICAKYPDKAMEIKTGALNTVQAGQFITIESTAEGRSGHFYDLCEEALNHELEGRPLTPLDWKIFFFPWYKEPAYAVPPEQAEMVTITRDLRQYFAQLETETGYQFSEGQIAWYALKKKQQGDEMLREYPSTPEEAFMASVEGAYFVNEMNDMRRDGRITKVPWVPSIPVNTHWDLGYNDKTTIIFTQKVGIEIRVIDYYENSGEGLAHYVRVLREKPYIYGRHCLPHDADHHSLDTGKTRRDSLYEMGLRPIDVVPRIQQEMDGIEASRRILPQVWIDKENCDRLITCLDHYRKEWDDKMGTWKNKARHDEFSDGYKAFETFAVGYRPGGHSRGSTAKRKSRNWRTV